MAPASAPKALWRGLAGAFSEGGSEPRDRSAPAPVRLRSGRGERSRSTKRRARERVGESEGRSPSDRKRAWQAIRRLRRSLPTYSWE
jgi:hypothetical protein